MYLNDDEIKGLLARNDMIKDMVIWALSRIRYCNAEIRKHQPKHRPSPCDDLEQERRTLRAVLEQLGVDAHD